MAIMLLANHIFFSNLLYCDPSTNFPDRGAMASEGSTTYPENSNPYGF